MSDVLILVVEICFLVGMGAWTLMRERRYASRTLTDVADVAVRQVYGVAHRRVAATSTRIPTHLVDDHTPVEGIALSGPVTVTIDPDPAEHRKGRAAAGRYAQHRRRGTLKISER